MKWFHDWGPMILGLLLLVTGVSIGFITDCKGYRGRKRVVLYIAAYACLLLFAAGFLTSFVQSIREGTREAASFARKCHALGGTVQHGIYCYPPHSEIHIP